jgi:pyruvate-formate lyase-activating enzyme
MATGGPRGEIDARIKAWERELERLRVWLASAPEPVHHAHHQEFEALYRRKEVARSRWEAIRGVYRPAPESVRAVEAALAEMESAWQAAQPLLAEMAAGRS